MDQEKLGAVLVEFSSTLVGDFYIQSILDRFCRRVLEVIPADGAGVLLLDDRAQLRFVAASDERILVIETSQLEVGEGPCITCCETGEAVLVPDLAADARFEQFSARAMAEGLGAVHTFPLRLDERRLGALDVYSREPRVLRGDDVAGLQVLADVAAAYIVNAQARAEATESADTREYRTLHDPLTRLPNRALMEDRLRLALARCERSGTHTGLLFVDLDRFKTINESYGHGCGDRLLIAVVRRLAGAVRAGDTLARMGADEFSVVCEELSDLEHAEELAQRVHAALVEEPFVIDAHSITLTASIGVAVSADPTDEVANLLLHAEIAKQEAKRRGGARSESATTTVRSETHRRLGVEHDLRQAIANDELELAYQPIVELATGRATGVEALLRWTHPQLRAISPPSIVAAAEQTGLMLDLGAWVTRTACEQLRRWDDDGVSAEFLCVNVAAGEFTDPGHCDTIAEILDTTAIDPARLCLEVTESVLIDDVPGALAAFDALKRVGVRLALDDFGTGYSSLSYLKRFPVDVIKVDRSFIAGVCAEHMDQAIITAVVALAHETGMTVVAEGVEDSPQHEEITRLGCDFIQGYFFAPPVPAQAAVELLQAPPL